MTLLFGESDPALLKDETLVDIFQATVSSHPDQPAVSYSGKVVTYKELSRRADQICQLLIEHGVGEGDKVALLIGRSIEACAALLGIMKAGAAYVPIDPTYPEKRIAFMVDDCDSPAVLTTKGLVSQASRLGTTVIEVDFDSPDFTKELPELPLSNASVDDIAYVIYTSGTTGKSKGVPITHRSICNFVRAEAKLFHLSSSDRVYHGFSLSFDASLEELWLAWFSGACLVIAPDEIARSGPELAIWLANEKITVLSCVPTLLSLFDKDIPSLTLLLVGGEACPQSLVDRWATDGRLMANTYGPTEATVVATYAWLKPGKPVKIGHLMPNYSAVILDENLHAVLSGEAGELCLGGPGLAYGYLNRDDLTKAKFIANPQSDSGDAPARLYRTGDKVKVDPEGELEFLGRIDDQVKLRGYRIELGDIEAALRSLSGVRQAAATVREDSTGIQQLVGYVVPVKPGDTLDEQPLRTILRSILPSFMVPAYLEVIDTIPTLVSGKIDRSSLPPPKTTRPVEPQIFDEGVSETERQVMKVWAGVFGGQPISHSDNFFDLGGHSLLAALMISELRKHPDFSEASVVDVYRHPVLSDFAAALEERIKLPPESEITSDEALPKPVGRLGRWSCWAAQLLGLYFVFAIFSLEWFIPWFVFDYFEDAAHRVLFAVLLGLAVAFAFQPVQMLLCVALKRLVIGKYKEGDYPLWGFYYWRFWLVRSIYRLFPFSTMHGTPFMAMFCRWLGSDIGTNVHLACDLQGSDLIEIGEGSSINAGAQLHFYCVENGVLKLRRIRIGKNCEIGSHSVVEGGAVMKDNSRLGPLSLLPKGTTLPENETWEGSPARPVQRDDKAPAPPPINLRRKFFAACFYTWGWLALAMFPLIAVIPGGLLLSWVDNNFEWYWSVLTTPAVVALFMIMSALQIAAAKWILMGKVRPGRHPLHGWFYVRNWLCDQFMHLSLDLLFPAYSTIYLPNWLRMLGAKLGARAEVSTMINFTPDLIDIGSDVFVADDASVGAARVSNGWLELAPVKIGEASFIGNSAVVPGGTKLGDKTLIGCLSLAPRSPADQARYDASWMGSPAIFLPNRPVNTQFSSEFTYKPSFKLYVLRAAIEMVRMILPGTVVVATSFALMTMVSYLGNYLEWHELIPIFPFFTVLLGAVAAIFTIAMKWLLIGRYREGETPLWSTFVWRSELVTALHDYLAAPMFLGPLKGTPFFSWYLRAMGARVGSNVYFDSTFMTEFDLVEIGSNCCIDTDCNLQTHLFEDRVMKMSSVKLGNSCSVGGFSTVLYDTNLEEGVVLAPLSLVLKGETLPVRRGRWIGSPVRAQAGDKSPLVSSRT